MDPDYTDEEDADAQAMAAAMGFSGFGKPPTKKRRFNPATDGYVDGQELLKLDKGGKKGQGSGGNTVPLGKTRAIGITAVATSKSVVVDEKKGNEDEIDLDEDGLDAG
jgi:hypothetical protein